MTQRSKIDVLELENFFSDQKQILQDTRSERRAVDRTFCWRLSNVQRLLLPSLLLNVILLGLNLVQMFGLASIQGNKYRASISTWSPPSISSSPSKIIRSNVTGYIPYEKIFGHVHIAKSAGTEINGELAAHYERVCGHKG